MRILYVEDDAIYVAIIEHALTRSAPGHVLDIAGNLAQAKAMLAGQVRPDVVLCDLHLPDGNGMELLAHIRASDIPAAVVILTATGNEESVVAALRAGANAYLIKDDSTPNRLAETLSTARSRFLASSIRRGRPLKVLYATDAEDGAGKLQTQLACCAPHFHVDIVHSPGDLLSRLSTDLTGALQYDAVVLDFRMPRNDTLGTVRELREKRNHTLPIIVLAEHGNEGVAAQALMLGVDDYVIKHDGYQQALPTQIENVCQNRELLRDRATLEESEARIRLLLDSTAEAIYGNDLEGRCTFVNPAFLRVLGYDQAEDLLGKPVHGLIHHSHADGSPYPREDCPIYQAYRHDEAIHREDEVFWHRDGHPIPVEYWSYPMHRDGAVVGAVATFFDISERKRAEEKLRQAAMVFENTRDGVMITDARGRLQAVNQAFEAITGYPEEEAIGQDTAFLRSGHHDDAFFQAMGKTLASAGYWQGEVWNRRKNGEIYPEWLTISSVRDARGNTEHYVSVFTDLSQIKRNEAQLEHLAHYDPLTGLPNRALVQMRLDHALDRAKRHGQRIGILFIDLDHFKTVNESLGHAIGDELLVEVARRLKTRVREEDTLGRVGGDAFALLLEPIDEAQEAVDVARDLHGMLAQPFHCTDQHDVFLGASIGICIFPGDGESVASLLRGAESAMYQAKESGRNQTCCYDARMNTNALAKLELETALRKALERGEFLLHYQPKVDLQSGQIKGAEALLRWRKQSGELVSPGHFIPLAERTGLIVPLGAWAIDEACRQIRAWQDAGMGEVHVAVNVSARQFRAGDLLDTISNALRRHGIPARLLELELTESMLMEDPQATIGLLQQLKDLGVNLALDDFGTGYSSFAYLGRFPIDTLKIDQSFVRNIASEPSDASIVSAIIGLAQRLRLRVVAEGVETEAQLGYLKKLGCELIQGYLVGRPVAPDEFVAMINRERPVSRVPAGETDTPRTLLLVDDEPYILSALKRMLRGEGYQILSANSASEGLELMAKNDVQVILSDQRMPEMSGTEFLGRVKDLYPDTVRIVLSGFSDLETIIQAVNQGAIYKFLSKPWDDALLREQIRDAFRYFEAILKNRSQSSNPGEQKQAMGAP